MQFTAPEIDELCGALSQDCEASHSYQKLFADLSLSLDELLNSSFKSRGGASVAHNVTACIAYGQDHDFLFESALSLSVQSLLPGKILIGVDGATRNDMFRLSDGVTIFRMKSRRGPFKVMHDLINYSDTEFVLISDSDDISHQNRLQILLECAHQTKSHIVGSSVAYFDELSRIHSIGVFPKNPAAAFQRGMCHAMLYPSCLISRDLFFRVGGFSDFESFGMDSEFILRACRYFTSSNVHWPLYLKRDRAGSLTDSDATGMKSLRRQRVIEYTLAKFRELYF